MPSAASSPETVPPHDARPAREAPDTPLPRPGPLSGTTEREVAPAGSRSAAPPPAPSSSSSSSSSSPSRSPSPDPSHAAPASEPARAPEARPAPGAEDAGAARIATRPVASRTTGHRPPPDERALSRALAGAHIEVRTATPHAPTSGAPTAAPVAAPPAPPPHAVPTLPPAGPARVVVADDDPDPLRAYLRAAPLAPTPTISAPRPPAAAVAREAPGDSERAALAPLAQPQGELRIDHIDVQVIGEPPAPSDQRARAQPAAPVRSGAWAPAARYYLGRLS